jgi:hypothetical protein
VLDQIHRVGNPDRQGGFLGPSPRPTPGLPSARS